MGNYSHERLMFVITSLVMKLTLSTHKNLLRVFDVSFPYICGIILLIHFCTTMFEVSQRSSS